MQIEYRFVFPRLATQRSRSTVSGGSTSVEEWWLFFSLQLGPKRENTEAMTSERGDTGIRTISRCTERTRTGEETRRSGRFHTEEGKMATVRAGSK